MSRRRQECYEVVRENEETKFERLRKLGKGAMNCHHLIWEKRDHHDKVRACQDFQPQMYIPAHNQLHKDCPKVPKFSQPLLEVIRADFKPTGDTFNSLDKLLFLINGEKRLDGGYKDLCLHALESQIPYLRGNIKPAKGYHK